jgi:hypothetical protein
MTGPVIFCYQIAEIWVVRVLVPTVVVPEVPTGVVWRIGDDEVNLAPFPVQLHHGLQILTLDYLAARLLLLGTSRILGNSARGPWLNFTSNLLRNVLARESDLDAFLPLGVDKFQQFFPSHVLGAPCAPGSSAVTLSLQSSPTGGHPVWSHSPRLFAGWPVLRAYRRATTLIQNPGPQL